MKVMKERLQRLEILDVTVDLLIFIEIFLFLTSKIGQYPLFETYLGKDLNTMGPVVRTCSKRE